MTDELDLLDRYMDSAARPARADLETARRRLDSEIDREIGGQSTGSVTPMPESQGRRSALTRPLVALGSVAAVVLLATAVLVPLAGYRPPTGHRPAATGRPVEVSRTWTLAGYISLPGWQITEGGRSLSTSQQFTTEFTCPSVTTCYSAGTNIPSTHENSQGAITVSHDGGATWRQSLSSRSGTYFFSITCPTPSTCMAPGVIPGTRTPPAMYTTTDGGDSWTSLPLPGVDEAFILLSCPATSTCVAMELDMGQDGRARNKGVSYVTSDGGHHWTASAVPRGFVPSGSSSLQCFPGGRCIAAGTETAGPAIDTPAAMIYSTDDGASWTTGSVPTVPAIASMMSCVDADHCVSIEQKDLRNGQMTASGVLVTDDGGRTWKAYGGHDLDPVNDRKTALNFGSISCSTASDCFATGLLYESLCQGSCPYVANQGVIMGTVDGGRTWRADPLPAPPSPTLQYVSVFPMTCVTETDCLAVATLGLSQSGSNGGLPPVEQDVVLTNSGASVRTRSSTTG
ncbi:MAG TPA: hypothetical protein VN796_05355 [Acidimicrobiales bacterium]|nr:hypothetical protein [Acidimicrobiales bacterium]